MAPALGFAEDEDDVLRLPFPDGFQVGGEDVGGIVGRNAAGIREEGGEFAFDGLLLDDPFRRLRFYQQQEDAACHDGQRRPVPGTGQVHPAFLPDEVRREESGQYEETGDKAFQVQADEFGAFRRVGPQQDGDEVGRKVGMEFKDADNVGIQQDCQGQDDKCSQGRPDTFPGEETDDKGEKISQNDPVREVQQGHLDIVHRQGKEDAGSRRKKEKEDEKRQELPERIQQQVLETPFLHIFLYVHQRGMRTISG